jgi:hypothetical protein
MTLFDLIAWPGPGSFPFCSLLFEFGLGYRVQLSQAASQHFGDKLDARQGGCLKRADQFAIAENRDPVGNLVDLIEKVGDENNSNPLTLNFLITSKSRLVS